MLSRDFRTNRARRRYVARGSGPDVAVPRCAVRHATRVVVVKKTDAIEFSRAQKRAADFARQSKPAFWDRSRPPKPEYTSFHLTMDSSGRYEPFQCHVSVT
ncbi:hypothetical protein ISCGN_011525 [Ixodes scapularis]